MFPKGTFGPSRALFLWGREFPSFANFSRGKSFFAIRLAFRRRTFGGLMLDAMALRFFLAAEKKKKKKKKNKKKKKKKKKTKEKKKQKKKVPPCFRQARIPMPAKDKKPKIEPIGKKKKMEGVRRGRAWYLRTPPSASTEPGKPPCFPFCEEENQASASKDRPIARLQASSNLHAPACSRPGKV